MKPTGLERTLSFINGDVTDRPPFHPIIMRWAASQAGVNYRDFCTIPAVKCEAMIKAAVNFDIDWVTVMSDPWAEASAFGIEVDYPENDLPLDTGGHMPDARSAALLKTYEPEKNNRCASRIEEIRYYRHSVGHKLFIVGWIEGPVAEYVDLRRASEAAMDFYLDPDNVEKAMNIITESAKKFITLQINAGAHCIGIGDAFCSQIGPDLYFKFAFEREKQLVDHIHHHGAIAKLHICGNTTSILPGMIRTGADIIDIDHLVPSMKEFLPLLSPTQVFSGKSDPVSVIQDGTRESIYLSAKEDHRSSEGRCIVSAGCEITPGTRIENIIAFADAAKSLFMGGRVF
jgi:MtaA/CmuA family methyltransferase